MSDSCLNCGGLIMEQGTTYGYAGKVCHCPVNPKYLYQRPASKESHLMVKIPKTLTKEEFIEFVAKDLQAAMAAWAAEIK